MIDETSKTKLYLITFIVDFYIVIMLSFLKLNFYDLLWFSSLLFVHFMFYISIFYNLKKIIHILHITVFMFPTLAVFSSHLSIKILSLLFLLLIQILWIKEKRCILNESDDKFGYGDELSLYVLFLTALTSIMIGKNMNN